MAAEGGEVSVPATDKDQADDRAYDCDQHFVSGHIDGENAGSRKGEQLFCWMGIVRGRGGYGSFIGDGFRAQDERADR